VRHRPTPPPAPAPGRFRAAVAAVTRPGAGSDDPGWASSLALTVLMTLALVAPLIGGATSPLLDGAGQGGAAAAAVVPEEQVDASAGPAMGGTPVVPPAPVAVPAATAPAAPPAELPVPGVPSPSEPSATVVPSVAAPAPGAAAAAPAPKATPKPAPRPAPAPAPAPAPRPAPAPPAPAPAGDEQGRVLALVNEARAGAGCAAVTADAGLAGVARAHSAGMRDRGFFDHTDLDGLSPFDRADRAGVTNARAENIARGQQDAAAVMEAWLTSPGHRQNILNCDYRTMGLGVATGSGGPWWTQMFGV
jgi:uncharacterized protein YkwD